MESLALTARPELREEDYRKRITAQEARKALLRMLPGIELNAGANYDSNKYLDNQSWADAGLQVSWNLFSVFSGPAARRYAEGQMDLGDLRRLALSVAVITQVQTAVISSAVVIVAPPSEAGSTDAMRMEAPGAMKPTTALA